MKSARPTMMRSVACWLFALIARTATNGSNAKELNLLGENGPAFDFHGFISQGFLASSEYNYLADSSHGSFKFTEGGLNVSFNPISRTRIAAQGFTYEVGEAGEYSVLLDYAMIEYTVCDTFGIRAGRIRRSEGIYNDIQDVDLSRTWVLLPQGIYPARWRDFYVSIDGAEIFGVLPLKQAGSLSYQLFYGLQRPKLNGGLALQKLNMPPYMWVTSFNTPGLAGTQLWWNTPVDGLRVGAAVNKTIDLEYLTVNGRKSTGSPLSQHYSLEYTWKSWTFQAEYQHLKIEYLNTGGGIPASKFPIDPDTWYVSTSYRFNKWVEVGSYYQDFHASAHNRKGVGLPASSDASQKDVALALRIDPTSWWIFKVEGHYMRGTAQLFDNVSNPVRKNDGWYLMAVKSTFSF